MCTWRSLARSSARPPAIVVGDEFINPSLQIMVTKYEPVIQAFVANGAHPALGDRMRRQSSHHGRESGNAVVPSISRRLRPFVAPATPNLDAL